MVKSNNTSIIETNNYELRYFFDTDCSKEGYEVYRLDEVIGFLPYCSLGDKTDEEIDEYIENNMIKLN